MSEKDRQVETYIEEISDDFESTFTTLGNDVFQNLLGNVNFGGLESDKALLLKIVNKYIPDSELEYTKLGWLLGEYDCYIIKRVDSVSFKEIGEIK